ncbi:MAG: dephospho-CoA kinase [Alphaproteobacteria bacterium]
MVVVGLTGSIAMGKSTTAGMFRAFGWPVFDADLAVHDLMRPGGEAVAAVLAAFPDVASPASGIDRAELGRAVFGDPAALKRLEAVVHPRVRRAEERFLAHARRRGERAALLDIPLLFEGGGSRRCDLTVVASASRHLQAVRALARPGMTRARLDAILAKQMPDREKRRRADFVVRTGLGRAVALADVRAVVRIVEARDQERR